MDREVMFSSKLVQNKKSKLKSQNKVGIKAHYDILAEAVTGLEILDNYYFDKEFEEDEENISSYLGKRRKKTPKKSPIKIRLTKKMEGSKEKILYKTSDKKDKKNKMNKNFSKYFDKDTGCFYNSLQDYKKLKALKLMKEIQDMKKLNNSISNLMECKQNKICN